MTQEKKSEKTKRPAVFFDRDGVINKDKGYTYKHKDWEWVDGAIQAIKQCNDAGYLVFVVTNQSGVGRGLYTEEDVHSIHEYMQNALHQHGAHIDDIRYCPHHIDAIHAEYKIDCDCRKPASGMLKDLFSSWPIEKSQSVLVGDKLTDLEAAMQVGIKGLLFKGGNLKQFLSDAGYLV